MSILSTGQLTLLAYHCTRKQALWRTDVIHVLGTVLRGGSQVPVGTVSNLPAAGIRLGRERPYHSSAGVSSVRKDGDFWCFPILPSPIALQLWESGQGPYSLLSKSTGQSSARLHFWLCPQAWSGPGLTHHRYQTCIFYGYNSASWVFSMLLFLNLPSFFFNILCVWMLYPHVCLWTAWNWSYKWLVATYGSPGPLKEQQVLCINTEPRL